MQRYLSGGYQVRVTACESQVGSGARPTDRLASAGLAIEPVARGRGEGRALAELAAALRALPVPVIGRVSDGALLLDLRCLEDESTFLAQLAELQVGPMAGRGGTP
jgi:L-seryl-tRNA(Ser) seleniumtransferase